MRVFLDANVLFFAADPASATSRLLNSVARHSEAVTSSHAWEEARRNLEQKRPVHAKGLDRLRGIVKTMDATAQSPETNLPPSDIPILAGAIGAGCTHLWTSDRKHFGSYFGRRIGGVRVISSILLADEIPKG